MEIIFDNIEVIKKRVRARSFCKRVIQVASSVPVAGYCGLAGKPGVAP